MKFTLLVLFLLNTFFSFKIIFGSHGVFVHSDKIEELQEISSHLETIVQENRLLSAKIKLAEQEYKLFLDYLLKNHLHHISFEDYIVYNITEK